MIRISVEKTVTAPADRVGAAFDDFANVYKFHPAVENSVSTNGRRGGVGAERVCHLYDAARSTRG